MHLQVGAYRWKVRWKRPKKGDAGNCQYLKQRIDIDPAQGGDGRADTLLHELLHAAWYVAGITEFTSKQEERVVGALSPLLLDVLRRNPKLVQELGVGQ